MEWNPIKNEYCLDWYKYMGDEYFMDPRNYNWNRIDESYDILPMGYMIFIMLTGLWPYYDFSESQSREVQKLALKGIRPYINPAYGSRSIIESRLVELMFKCLDPDPAHRPDAFEIVRFLRSTRHLHEQETKAIMTKRHF
jgi:serine/threonine protein kinase